MSPQTTQYHALNSTSAVSYSEVYTAARYVCMYDIHVEFNEIGKLVFIILLSVFEFEKVKRTGTSTSLNGSKTDAK